MNALEQRIYQTIDSIEETTALFYQQKTEDGYQRLQATLEGIIGSVDQLYTQDNVQANNSNDILNILNTAMAALENKDTILLSDILKYDLKQELVKAAKSL
jgi:hypothetical protein